MDTKEATTSQTNVALELTKQLFLTEFKDKNMVFSPLSLHIVLSLIASGTKGPCLDQFLCFLKSRSTHHLNSLTHDIVTFVLASADQKRVDINEEMRYGPGPCLSIANGVWVDKSVPFKPYFKHVADTAYMASLEEVDFKSNPGQVSAQVNSWAEKETNGLIKEILPPGAVDSKTRLILANALYFKAYWVENFRVTINHDFYLHDGSSVKAVPFMRGGGRKYVRAYKGFKVLKLPYQNNGVYPRRFSMYFYLPDAIDGLPALVERVCSESRFLDSHVPHEEVGVGEMLIPKFKISSGFEASGVLKTLGLVLPFVFDPVNKGGNVTEMVESPAGQEPYVEAIIHKTCIEINEKGTEASAFTLGLMRGGGGPPPNPIHFVADHPFMFFIREDSTGTVLFMGQVLNPLAG